MLRNLVSNIFNVIRIGLDALYDWLGSNLGSVFCILITISQTSISTSVILHICIKEWKELHFHVTRFLSMTLSTFIKTHILYSEHALILYACIFRFPFCHLFTSLFLTELQTVNFQHIIISLLPGKMQVRDWRKVPLILLFIVCFQNMQT